MRKCRCHRLAGFAAAFLLLGSSLGCVPKVSALNRSALLFSNAAVVVTHNSEDAYAAANTLHSKEQVALAVLAYDQSPAWNPENFTKPLLSDEQLEARRQVMQGLRSYAASLADLTSTSIDKDLGTSAQALGTNLQQLSGNLNTAFATAGTASISDTEKNALSTALVALGTYLKQRSVARKLPAILQQNDKTITDISDALIADIRILRRQADRDYGALEVAQDQYIRKAQPPLAADQRRAEIARLPAMVLEQQRNDLLLSKLQQALQHLAVTHHALALSAEGGNSPSLAEGIAQLYAEGQALAHYNESLSRD